MVKITHIYNIIIIGDNKLYLFIISIKKLLTLTY